MQLKHKTLFLFSQKTTHEVFSFTFPKLFFIGNNVFALICIRQERLSLIRPVLKMSVFIFTNNFKVRDMFLHLFPCWWDSKILCTHTIVCIIQLLRMFMATRDHETQLTRIKCPLSKHKHRISLSVSLILKSHIFRNAPLEMTWGVKMIFTIACLFSIKRILSQMLPLVIQLLCLG